MTQPAPVTAGDAAWAEAEARRIAREFRERQVAQRRRETPPVEAPGEVAQLPPTAEPSTRGENEMPEIPTPMPTPSTWADMAESIGPIEFDWPLWLARRFLHLLVGESGKGKSALSLRAGACYIRGDPWPDGTPFSGVRGRVLWVEGESAQVLNLSRATAWGLDTSAIISPFSDPLQDANLDNPQHRASIIAAAKLPDVQLVIVDSLSGVGGGRRDENSTQMLQIVHWLAQLARDTGKPVLCTHHLRKRSMLDGDGDDVNLSRVRGSSAITQCARVVWALDSPIKDDPEALRLSVVKSNLAKFPGPIGVTIDDAGVSFGSAPETPRELSATERARQFLECELAGGPVKKDQIDADAKLAGVSLRSLRRAKDDARIRTYREMDCWWWTLPGPA